MRVRENLARIQTVEIPAGSAAVYRTAAEELARRAGAGVVEADEVSRVTTAGVFRIGTAKAAGLPSGPRDQPAVLVRLGDDGSGLLAASHDRFLYAAARYLIDGLPGHDAGGLREGILLRPAFAWNRSCYDLFLTQEGRVQRGLNRETYVRRLAESGFTHVEVNGLAFPMGLETGPKGEVYAMFYTYCPALDQFVYSSLNKGLYPFYYLSANLAYLKENAALARRYGLVPGLLSFEPRSVPEEFFARYPMLRGARVDHPFRSFKPRYTMTIAHPLVREHYAELIRRLLDEVPDLGFMTVWSNDSGAGFEHTKSLYVGRNGGPYMIREWKDDDEIARVAGEHVVLFLRVLRDAAREVSPDFRVITRMESFYGEHDSVWRGLSEGIEVETTSLIARGWSMPYRHPRYPDSDAINGGTVYQLGFDAKERVLAGELAVRGSAAHFYSAVGPHQMFAPLVGVPYPRLTWRRLRLLSEGGVRCLAQIGGTVPPELVPYNANHEIVRRFQFNPALNVDRVLADLAGEWAGAALAPALVWAWALAEEAIEAFPNVSPLYSTIGFTWYRLWVRPLVPNIEAIPLQERAYYEDFMCTTPHNPNNVDLSRDVLFRLTTPEKCRVDVERIDAGVWEPLDEAIGVLDRARAEADETLGPGNVITDQLLRLRALRCWLTTQRSVAAWVAGVCGWMEATSAGEKARSRALVRDMMAREIANTRELQSLLDAGVEFMATSATGESPLMHGGNLKQLLATRVALMERHIDDEPFIDHRYMERMAGQPAAATGSG